MHFLFLAVAILRLCLKRNRIYASFILLLWCFWFHCC